tara:strand:+ start:113 stop:226 length:114 start_codon:yes stop_codon:yes gene_type:complete
MKKERENMTVQLMKVKDYYGDNDHEIQEWDLYMMISL